MNKPKGESQFGDRKQSGNFSALDLKGLSHEQQTIVREYLRMYEPGLYMQKQAELLIDFLKHPETYEPTPRTFRSAYVNLVIRRFDGEKLSNGKHVIFQDDITDKDIDRKRLKNVRVYLTYKYSSTANAYTAILRISANVRKDENSEWEEAESGGIAFSLDDWVQKKNRQKK